MDPFSFEEWAVKTVSSAVLSFPYLFMNVIIYVNDSHCVTTDFFQLQKGESMFSFARDMTRRSTETMLEEAMSEDEIDEKALGPWRSKLLWASRVLPMPLVGLLLIETVCSNEESQASSHPILEALSRLDFGSALKILLAEIMVSE